MRRGGGGNLKIGESCNPYSSPIYVIFGISEFHDIWREANGKGKRLVMNFSSICCVENSDLTLKMSRVNVHGLWGGVGVVQFVGGGSWDPWGGGGGGRLIPLCPPPYLYSVLQSATQLSGSNVSLTFFKSLHVLPPPPPPPPFPK